MSETVHILATVRRAELMPAALLVFRTLRTGFPEASVRVWGNGLDPLRARIVEHHAAGRGASFENLPYRAHDEWIETLVQGSLDPFWVLDTDVVFFGEMKRGPAKDFAGEFEPAWFEGWTQTQRVSRLHTAVMWIDPAAVRMELRRIMGKVPEPWGSTAEFPLVKQTFIPQRDGPTLFYDTMAGLYQAGCGRLFDPDQYEVFEHLHCATYVDMMAGHPSAAAMAAVHQAVYADPAAARGLREQKLKWIGEHKTKESYAI